MDITTGFEPVIGGSNPSESTKKSFCPPTRDRTWDRLLKRQLLYQLSYGRLLQLPKFKTKLAPPQAKGKGIQYNYAR